MSVSSSLSYRLERRDSLGHDAYRLLPGLRFQNRPAGCRFRFGRVKVLSCLEIETATGRRTDRRLGPVADLLIEKLRATNLLPRAGLAEAPGSLRRPLPGQGGSLNRLWNAPRGALDQIEIPIRVSMIDT
jgi:hypothetical protein